MRFCFCFWCIFTEIYIWHCYQNIRPAAENRSEGKFWYICPDRAQEPEGGGQEQ